MTRDGSIPVLLDTDIGSDIDDALALSYLLAQPRCELVGITTVTGVVAERAACARAVCQAAGQPEIPIHQGLSDVLLFGPGQPKVPHYPAIAARAAAASAPTDAVEFLRASIRARPGEITLLSIGPLTNVGVLFALDPEIPSLLRSFVSMAGAYAPNAIAAAEWNLRVDPVAAAIAYRRSPTGHLSVGLDVTQHCALGIDVVRQRLRRPPLDVVLDMAEVWFRNSDRIVFHDPLAAALIFNPGICDYVDGEITVSVDDGSSPFAAGDGRGGRHRVASSVDADAFFVEFFGVFG